MKVVELNKLCMKFKQKLVLKNITLNLEEGNIYGLVGKNGAGKTTMMKIILGLLPGYKGEVRLFESTELEKQRRKIGALIETPVFYESMTGYENLNYYRIANGLKNTKEIDELLKLVKLEDAGNRKYKTYSLGMKQRLGIAYAMLGDPEFLVLDEPINGIDPEGIVEIRNLFKSLAKNGKTILISSHLLNELEQLSDDIFIIENGELIDEIITSKKEESKFHTMIVTDNDKKFEEILKELGLSKNDRNEIDGVFDINTIVKKIYSNNLNILELERRKNNLEEYYIDQLERRN
ncbi:MAG: ATP-binding cassette domain-containing protein [Ezakiella sp.]|nr:ATP-binding cassette domain-containing protein [Ezakiella sp.]MDD7471505.1 ATP-binding cassette domain-containing protein [Bacillota bacterium]MDY3923707.1 ATP-binding cassette domain-containing protein [Ezakiella sp.]